jgi:hypothetical protein
LRPRLRVFPIIRHRHRHFPGVRVPRPRFNRQAAPRQSGQFGVGACPAAYALSGRLRALMDHARFRGADARRLAGGSG